MTPCQTNTQTPTWVGISSEQAAERAGRRGLGLFISGAFSKSREQTHRRAPGSLGKIRSQRYEATPVGLLRNLWIVDNDDEQRQALDWVRSSYLVYAGLGWGADNTGVDFVSEIETSMNEVEKNQQQLDQLNKSLKTSAVTT